MTSIIYYPALGKPNPLEDKAQGPDQRSRVDQKNFVFDCCVFGAFSILRERYKAPNTDHLEERRIERICSQRKKELILLKKTIPSISNQIFDPSTKKILLELTKNGLNGTFNMFYLKVDMLDAVIAKEAIKGAPFVSLRSVCAEFQNSRFSNLYDFLFHRSIVEVASIQKKFLNNMGVDIDKKFSYMSQDLVFKSAVGNEWNNDSEIKYAVLSQWQIMLWQLLIT